MNVPNLHNLMSYTNSKLIFRYNKDYPQAKLSAEEALNELMKFIWLCRLHHQDKQIHPQNEALNFSCVIHEEMINIDQMWHSFLLYTRDYQQFCSNYLQGYFFHHDPMEETKELSNEFYEQELELYLSYIHDNLGEDTLTKWFSS